MPFEGPVTCVGVIGAGHVGGPTAVMIAIKCPKIRVLVYDADPRKVSAWNGTEPPIYEPGLKQKVEDARGTNLWFVSDLSKVVTEAEVIFVAVTTPLKKDGIGAGEAPDVVFWERTARDIAALATEPKVVVERSTVPVRTAQIMAAILKPPCAKVRHEVLSNPSFFATGSAMVDLASPDVTLIGCRQKPEGRAAAKLLASVFTQWIPAHKIKTSDLWSAELSKLTANAFLAQRVSSINAISAVCEATDADVTEVAKAIGTDSRIGNKFLQAGVGFGGACYPTHLRNLVYLCKHYELFEAAAYWQSVLDLNEWQRTRFTANIVKTLFSTVTGKKLAILGFAYKKDTSDIRETPALYVCKRLLDEGARLSVYDPYVPAQAVHEALGVAPADPSADALPGSPRESVRCEVSADAYTACHDAHALVVLTGWDVFADLDFAKIHERMKRPAFVFDGRLCLPHDKLRALGFQVSSIGKAMPITAKPDAAKDEVDLKALDQPGPLDY